MCFSGLGEDPLKDLLVKQNCTKLDHKALIPDSVDCVLHPEP